MSGTYLLRRPPSGRWNDAAWEVGPDLRTGRSDHTCSLVRSTTEAASGKMLVVIVGGQMREGGITDSVELYDVASNKLSRGESRIMEFAKYQNYDPRNDILVLMKFYLNIRFNIEPKHLIWVGLHGFQITS